MPTATKTNGVEKDQGMVVERIADLDPHFDNSQLGSLQAGKVPYGLEQTYVAANGNRKEFLEKTKDLSYMQRHCVFWDATLSGVIRPIDTFRGFYALGFGYILSFIAIFVIHSAFAYPTQPTAGKKATWLEMLPDPTFTIHIGNINRCKHGSDSESYDRRGDFQEKKMLAVLDDYSSRIGRDALCFSDICVMLYGRRNLMDPFGIFAFVFEWGSSYMLVWPADGYLKREDIVGLLNGSIFVDLAHDRQKKGAFKAI